MLVLIPVIHMFYTYSTDQTDDLIVQRIEKIGNEMIDTAETVYYMGPPARVTIKQNFPEKIKDIKILDEGKQIVFYFGDKNSSSPFFSNIKMDGIYYEDMDTKCTDSDIYKSACFTEGNKEISFIANEDNVSVMIK
ncbi:MAG: hypothetical protein ACQEP1_06540 [Nanobdellota archaeon]